jgi:predicted nuclease of predicted toxin-antitoxin system
VSEPALVIRLLLDQGVPRDAAQQLCAKGFDTVHVGDLGMSAASDTEILDAARLRGEVVVTLDADFHAILAVSGAQMPSVIRVRMQGLNAAAFVRVLGMVLFHYQSDLCRGCMITVKERKTTCHRLPIGTVAESSLI